jgi:sugar (pentulose or hexulose) kinase
MVEQSKQFLILDVGKTNIKIHVVDSNAASLATFSRDNAVLEKPPYPHADIEGIWEWILRVFRECGDTYDVSAISVSAHGATAALVKGEPAGGGLVLPVLDYECTEVDQLRDAYRPIRPDFSETMSPELPAGLNLGRQLVWQAYNFPDEFRSAEAILMYPQYWTWRLTARKVSEVSSLGCHTDLWSPGRGSFSSLVENRGWQHLFPEIVPAWDVAGPLRADIAATTGLPGSCAVHVGVHDSNASFLRFRRSEPDKEFCVVSTGTWVVCMKSDDNLAALDVDRDMLANVDVWGDPVPCIRFMGGREYANICAMTGSSIETAVTAKDIEKLISDEVFALPQFGDGSGPFAKSHGQILGTPANGAALATLYCALMIDRCLELLAVEGHIFLVGSFLKNPVLCELVAQLRPGQRVSLSSDESGTVRGAAQLCDWESKTSVSATHCEGSGIEGLSEYRKRWLDHVGQ